MKNLTPINKNDAEAAKLKLQGFYKDKLIPAEKKTYLTKLEQSTGPYMGIECINQEDQAHYLLDVSSQIATLGLGFNSSVLMGTAQFLESWTNDPNTEDFRAMVKSYERFFARKLYWENVHLSFCHSGAEANETALGHCFAEAPEKAKKVLCFEGSFHGRMLISLFASWNKSKRGPFECPQYEAAYCPFPEIKKVNQEEGLNPTPPKDWERVWDQSSRRDFAIPSRWSEVSDPVLQLEINSLEKVREQLLEGEIFAIIVEPMQCEGGDRYTTGRFLSALLLMARCFDVPVIFDEVQTGFHLGREFFWHKALKLRGLPLEKNGHYSGHHEELTPDFVTCAKKAQIGIVISPVKYTYNKLHEGEFQVSSMIRGLLHALALDQLHHHIIKFEGEILKRLEIFSKKYAHLIDHPRVFGLAFAFDLKDPKKMEEVINQRFHHGLLYYPAGSDTLRFRANTAFRIDDLEYIFEHVGQILETVYEGKEHPYPTEFPKKKELTDDLIEFQLKFLELKHQLLRSKSTRSPSKAQIENELYQHFLKRDNLELCRIHEENFNQFSTQISELQNRNYEPARRTDISTFERTAKADNGLCLGVQKEGLLVGIIFAAPLHINPLDRGIRLDPHFGNEKVLYVVDTTIDKTYQGKGLGRKLKYAATLLAFLQGNERIQGRNRDKLAGGMLNINLSLGSYEQNYIPDDYKDFEKYRDVIYYTNPLTWRAPKLNLSNAIRSPLSHDLIDENFIKKYFSPLTNKICLSNFVSENYLINLKKAFELLPSTLRHGYSSSGQSEAVDKIAKSLWAKRDPKIVDYSFLSFEDHYFGRGSFLARSLSQSSNHHRPYFPVKKLPCPSQSNEEQVLKMVKKELENNHFLGIWIEPLRQIDLIPTSLSFLKELKKLAGQYQTPLIYNETASGSFRFDLQNFFAANIPEIEPDAGLVYMGGQSALVFMKEDYFVETPLMMISTWDGDEYSLASYVEASSHLKQSHSDFLKTVDAFHQKLNDVFGRHANCSFSLHHHVGSFKGAIPSAIKGPFEKRRDTYRVLPRYLDMKHYLEKI